MPGTADTMSPSWRPSDSPRCAWWRLGCRAGRVWPHGDASSLGSVANSELELEIKAIRRFARVSIVSYSRLSLMIIVSASQFHIYLPWGQCPFSIVS